MQLFGYPAASVFNKLSSVFTNTVSQLRGVTCHMAAHSVTFHPTQVNTPRLQPDMLVLDLTTLEGWKAELSWSRWPVTYRDGLPARRRSAIHPAVHGRESNSQPVDHKSDALTTTLPSHHSITSLMHPMILPASQIINVNKKGQTTKQYTLQTKFKQICKQQNTFSSFSTS